MKVIRYFLIGILFLVCMPLSWFAAYDASGSILTALFSLILPTWGLAYWVLTEAFGSGFGIGTGAFILGMIGSFLSLGILKALMPEDE